MIIKLSRLISQIPIESAMKHYPSSKPNPNYHKHNKPLQMENHMEENKNQMDTGVVGQYELKIKSNGHKVFNKIITNLKSVGSEMIYYLENYKLPINFNLRLIKKRDDKDKQVEKYREEHHAHRDKLHKTHHNLEEHLQQLNPQQDHIH